MSDAKSWKHKSTNYTEVAIETVRQCIAAMRAGGQETKNAIVDIAPTLGVSRRRIRSLFYRDGFPIVLKNEWLSMRYRAGLFFLNEAQRLRTLADHYETAGENLVAEQLQFSWETKWSENGSQKRSA
jgi:hypothetical protein